jgi:hypothetical protein
VPKLTFSVEDLAAKPLNSKPGLFDSDSPNEPVQTNGQLFKLFSTPVREKRDLLSNNAEDEVQELTMFSSSEQEKVVKQLQF